MRFSTLPEYRCFIALLFIGIIGFASPALALMYGPIGAPIPCPFDEGFTFLVVTCLQTAIEEATYRLLGDFSDIMQGPIGALIVVQISFFGVHAVIGSSEINKRLYGLLLKIGAVLLFADNLGGFAPAVFGIMEEAQRIIIDNIGYTGDMECDVTAAAAGAFFNSAIWIKLDCILNKLFQYQEPVMLFNAIFALLSAALFSGSLGVIIFFLGITMLLNILSYAFYAAYIFILAYIYVGFLIVISPLIIPMLLIGVGAGMYERWLYNLVGGIAIPVMVFAYLQISLPVLDYSIFSAQGSLEEVLGDDYSAWYRNEQQWCSQQIGTDPDNYRNVPVAGFDYITGPLKNILTPMLSGSTDYCATFGTSSLDFLEDHTPMLMDVLDALIRIMVTVYLLSTLMKKMPLLAASMFGGGFGLAKLSADGLPFSSAMRGGLQEAKASMTGAVRSTSGGRGFLSQGLPGATSGISGIFR